MKDYEVWSEDPRDARKYRTLGPEGAAQDWAEDEFCLCDAFEHIEVFVSDGKSIARVRITVEYEPSFYAELVEGTP